MPELVPSDLDQMYNMKTLSHIFTVFLLVCILVGCRSVRIVEVPVVHTEYIRHDSIVRDSIHQLDSVFVLVKGDTVYKEKYKYIYKDRLFILHDTLSSVDTLTVVKEVEKRLSAVQKAYISLGRFFACLLVVVFLWLVAWLMKKKIT